MLKDPIISKIDALFSHRIITLVGYGSYFFDRSDTQSDIDLCLVLDSRQPDDFSLLRELKNTYRASHIDITVHYLDEIERSGWENFQHGSHGIFFLKHLASTELLLGIDLFARKSTCIDKDKYLESLYFQINQYTDRIQTYIMDPSHDTNDYFYIKYFTRIMVDMLLVSGNISYREVNKYGPISLYDMFFSAATIFGKETLQHYKNLLDQHKTSSESHTTLLTLLINDHQRQKELINQTKATPKK